MMPPAELAGYTGAQLEAFYLGADDSPDTDEWRQIIAAEITAREDRARRKPARPAASRDEWTLMAHAQYLTAERECRGNLLSRRGQAAGVDPKTLWQGPLRTAEAYASEELREWWREHGRTDITTWQAQASGERRQWDDRKQAMAMDEMASRVVDHAERGYGTSPADARAENIRRADEARARIDARKAREAADSDAQEIARVIAPAGLMKPAAGAVAPLGGAMSRRDELAAEILAESLRYSSRVLTRHVAFPSDQALHTVLLWLFHANARDRDEAGFGPLIWRATPRLLATSKQRGSGKSTLLDLIGMLTANSGRPSKITPRSIAHKLSNKQETVTLDEAKLIFGAGKGSAELQGVLLAGYTRRGTYSYSSGGKDVDLSTFGPVAYAGKDELITDTGGQLGDLLDRSIVIRMKRPSKHYPDIDEAADRAAALAAEGMATWTSMKQADLKAAASRLNREAAEGAGLSAEDVEAGALRAAQIWRPLLACAAVMGGEWPGRARAAFLAGDSETAEWLASLHDLDADLFDDEDEFAGDFA